MAYTTVRDTITHLNRRLEADANLHKNLLSYSRIVPENIRRFLLADAIRLSTIIEQTEALRDQLAIQEGVA